MIGAIYGREVFNRVVKAAVIVFLAVLILFPLSIGIKAWPFIIAFALKFSAIIFIAIVIVLLALIFIAHFTMKPDQLIVAWKFTDDGAVLSDKHGVEVEASWSQIRGLRFTNKGIMVRSIQGSRWIPKRAFSDKQVESLKVLANKKYHEGLKC